MRHDWDSDEVLLDALRDALSTPPSSDVPPEFVEAAKAAFTWRTVDAELLLITSYDSVLDDTLFARARSTSTARQLVFDADGVTLQVEVSAAGVTGQLMPAAGDVTLVAPAGDVETAPVDELGMFVMGPGPRGPVKFRFAGGSTDWFIL
ncbi:hypothetical protein BBK82_24930 [Lentzea guizhouensis]|uniref:Uncharacterized protein n=1 Tax=Lentzea guizhouensis TaxID=1586287 RepID=A0A1B2HM66_9PSEU|nr:hypothetical protein [Lentzea guizhouensis]ANZ38827.1 hypothetical protein BBK82_24930 [Lentzea guizhouensis]